MKQTVCLMLMFSMVFMACTGDRGRRTAFDGSSGSAVSGTATESTVLADLNREEEESEDDPDMEIVMSKENRPMLSEKVNQKKAGLAIDYWNNGFSTRPTKGDDGNCYYYRRERKKRGKITFYKNNVVKVCETVMPPKYEKDYFIRTFLKQGERIWILVAEYDSYELRLIPVTIKDGKWGKAVKIEGERIIYYEGWFYSFDSYTSCGELDIIDQEGNTKKLTLLGEKESKGKHAELETIIDDKLYYILGDEENDKSIVMRCDLDGSHKEKLFQYKGITDTASRHEKKLTMDGDFLYLFCHDRTLLTRIPLYGGEAEEVVSADWYELTGDSIFYLKDGRISRIDKDLKGTPKTVMTVDEVQLPMVTDDWFEPSFLCADGHLITEVFDPKESYKLTGIWYEAGEEDYRDPILDEITMNYSNAYYWMTEDGKIENIIPGSGLDKEYQKYYEERVLPRGDKMFVVES